MHIKVQYVHLFKGTPPPLVHFEIKKRMIKDGFTQIQSAFFDGFTVAAQDSESKCSTFFDGFQLLLAGDWPYPSSLVQPLWYCFESILMVLRGLHGGLVLHIRAQENLHNPKC